MAKSDRIFITGATGFIGSYLLRSLIADGFHQIVAIKRQNSPMDLVKPVQHLVEWLEGDILDVPSLELAMSGCQKVYHCAAVVTQPRSNTKKMMRVNVEGTANVVNAANLHDVNKLLHISSISALGRHKKRQHLDENSYWQRNAFNTDYGISKYLGEQEVWRGIAEGLEAVIINPSVVIGSGFWEKGTARIFDTIWKGLRFYPPGTTGFVDVRDVARMSIQLMESEIHHTRVIANADNWDYRRFFSTVAEALGKPPPAIATNPLMSALVWRADWLRARLTGGEQIITRSRVRQTSCSYFYDNKRSKELLSFEYRPLPDTIAATAGQYLECQQNGMKADLLPL